MRDRAAAASLPLSREDGAGLLDRDAVRRRIALRIGLPEGERQADAVAGRARHLRVALFASEVAAEAGHRVSIRR